MDRAGGITTFYSYKGGTGRSMALSNLACLCALDGRREENGSASKPVVMIDWDLEAPGLHRFFPAPEALHAGDAAAQSRGGVIELFLAIAEAVASLDAGERDESAARRIIDDIDPRKFMRATSVDGLLLMEAGVFDGDYAERVGSFGWEALYRNCPEVFAAFASYLAEHFSHTWIDSRTGHTDTGGVCTMLLPDRLVAVFTPNRQSLSGLATLVRSAAAYRQNSADLRPLRIFPLPSRIENAEPRLREQWRYGDSEAGIDGYQPLFEGLFRDIYGQESCSLQEYFDEVQIQHVPRFAYGEEIAVMVEGGSRLSVTRSYRGFWERLQQLDAPWQAPPSPVGAPPGSPGGAPRDLGRLQEVGPYLVRRLIGEGSTGYVFEVEDSRSSAPRALKLLRPGVRVARERAEQIGRVEHPNVVSILDYGQDPATGLDYFTMTLVRGQSLDTLTPLDPADAVRISEIFGGMLSGLRALHHAGLAHGDLKPSNIVVDGSNRAVLTDLDVRDKQRPDSETTMEFLVTPAYTSPEQARGAPASERGDLYAVGATLYRCLTGRSIYAVWLGLDTDAVKPQEIMRFLLSSDSQPTIAAEDFAGVSVSLRGIIEKATQLDPDRRYQSVVEMEADLSIASRDPDAAVTLVASSSSHPQIESERSAVSASVRAVGWIVLGAGLGGLAGALWWLWSSGAFGTSG